MPSGAPQLVLLPGLGADARFLHHQQRAFPDLITPPWIDPEPRETLAHYAERFAATVRADGPMVVGGVSLGGMLALEMAKHLDTRAIVLISSCRGPGPVNPLLKLCERGSRLLPGAVLSFSHHFGPLVLGRGGVLAKEDRRLLVQMLRDIPVPFLRWGARAVLEWPGFDDRACAAPIRHIHGQRDWVIRPHLVRADKLIPGGMHVLNISHPREVNEFIVHALGAAGGQTKPHAEVRGGLAEVP